MCNIDLSLMNQPAVMKHLEILQGIITRMANNSASCKTWMLTIITGLIALSIEKGCFPIWISLIPTIMFFILDSFYLGLEKHFRKLYNDFVSKLADNSIEINDVYVINSKRNPWIDLKYIYKGMHSISTSFIYISIIVIVALIYFKII